MRSLLLRLASKLTGQVSSTRIKSKTPNQAEVSPVSDWPGPTPGAPILFLDFDGVLHPGMSETFEFLPDLYRVLDTHPTVEIVISSTWRFTETGENLRRLFASGYRERVVDVCGPELAVEHGRQAEIEAYVRRRGTARFIALDDRQDLFRPGCPWLFLVPRLQGVSGEYGARLIEALGRI